MLVYRIVLAKYADKLIGSGRTARWNPNEIEIIYTASSRALACLENVVNRDQVGLMQLFAVTTISCASNIKIKAIGLNELPSRWTAYDQMHIPQNIGENWVRENKSAILQVPSAIIEEEVNYLLNPNHSDFKQIRIVRTQPFVFDSRIKL